MVWSMSMVGSPSGSLTTKGTPDMIDIQAQATASAVLNGDRTEYHPAIEIDTRFWYFPQFRYGSDEEARSHAEHILNYWQSCLTSVIVAGPQPIRV